MFGKHICFLLSRWIDKLCPKSNFAAERFSLKTARFSLIKKYDISLICC